MNDITKYPNLFKVTRELARYKDPDKVLNGLLNMLRDNPGLMKEGKRDGQ